MLLAVVLLASCRSPADTAVDTNVPVDTDTDSDTDTESDTDKLTCAGTSDLAGVCIAFRGTGERWTLAEAAAGVSVDYAVIIDTAYGEVVPVPQDAGSCGVPGPSGLIVFGVITGGDSQQYCLCDEGRCGGTNDPVKLTVGSYADSYGWRGRNWFGPSDFGNPEGEPFPAGTYTLKLRAIGQSGGKSFTVVAERPIVLVP